MSGWIKIHRDILRHWVSQEPECLAVWVRLLAEANHEGKKHMFNGCLIDIERGQTIFGLSAFSKRSGVTIKKLRRYLDLFESEQMIGRQKTNKYSIISITNYAEYQQEAGKGQTKGKQRATPKEVKNIKNNKYTYSEIDFPTFPEKPSEQVWIDYLAMRKAKKAQVTPTVMKTLGKALTELYRLGYRVDDVLAQCITRNWTGLKPEWVHKPENSNGTRQQHSAAIIEATFGNGYQ